MTQQIGVRENSGVALGMISSPVQPSYSLCLYFHSSDLLTANQWASFVSAGSDILIVCYRRRAVCVRKSLWICHQDGECFLLSNARMWNVARKRIFQTAPRRSRLISEGSSWFTNMRSASATFANIFAAQSKKTSKLKVGALNSPPGSYPSLKGPTQTRLGPPRGSRWTWVKAAGRTTEIKRLQNAGDTPPPVGPCVSRRAVICHLGSHFGGGHIPQCPARQGATVPVAAH